jgi:hypothetical protein
MSLDMKAIRLDIAAVLATIPTFNEVDAYENRNRDLATMPFVQVWRDPITGPGTADAQPMFGHYAYNITWRLRAWIPLGDDQTAQDLSDTLSVAMREAFDTRPTLIANTVQRAALTNIVSDGYPDGEIPFMLIEGTLETEGEAAPGP